MMPITIKSPETSDDFKTYYHLRWQILRAPWHQPEGTEKDELENHAIHRMAVFDNKIIAVGRLHFIDKSTMQIRYMAVAKNYEKQGIGQAILLSLEQVSTEHHTKKIILHARKSVIGFYEKNGYQIKNKSHRLFNQIQHYEMIKKLV